MGYATGLMEYSDDPLSDATPTYVDRSSYVVGDVTWTDGKSRDLDEPQAGSIQFRLSNPDGEWVPNSPDSLYANSPFLLRRFRWSVNGTAEGVWYVINWQVTYPAGTDYSEVLVTAVDGFELLSLDNLALLDPPTATTYEEVVMHDQPFAYYRMNDPPGTQLTPVTGPEGVYKGAPVFNQAGLLVGDSDKAVQLNRPTGGLEAYARAPIESGQFVDTNQLTLELWVRTTTPAASHVFMHGPTKAPFGQVFRLGASASSLYEFGVTFTDGTTAGATSTTATGSTDHLVGTWDGATARIYVNGVLEASGSSGPKTIHTGDSDMFLKISQTGVNQPSFVADEVAFYESCLSPERILAHYNAGALRGLPALPAGERIVDVVDNPLWSTAFVQVGSHEVHAQMEYGQSRIDEIRAAVKAEMPDTHFFFDGDGHPVYLAWDYKGTAPYNETQGVFGHLAGNTGVIGCESMELVYDDEMFNEVTVGHEAAPGEETQHTETDAASVSDNFRRAHAETGLILTDHMDAIAVAAAILEVFHTLKTRVASLTLNGAQASARTHILQRKIGDLIRVKGAGGSPDVLTTILGRTKTLTAAGHLSCTWTLSRGLDASADAWYLGIDGYSELGQETVLG